MSNSLDPDQVRRFVRPDLGPNCLPRLSPDELIVISTGIVGVFVPVREYSWLALSFYGKSSICLPIELVWLGFLVLDL